MIKLIARLTLGLILLLSTMTFILVNVPVVRDVAKSKMPLVLVSVGISEALAFLTICGLLYAYNVLNIWKNRIGAEGEFFVLLLTVFSAWATLRFPIWTRWGFIKRFCELQSIDASKYEDLFYQLGVVAAVLCVPFLYVGWRWLYAKFMPGIVRFFQSLTRAEWLYFSLFWGLGAILLVTISFQTSVFTFPMPLEKPDEEFPMGISVSDSALLINGDTFCNNTSSANDVRQPLFAIFSAPFAMFSHIMASTLWLTLPGVFEYKYIYAVAIAFWQIGAFAVVGLLIRRIVASFTDESFSWAVAFLYSVTWSTVIFALTVEQYAFSLLALIIFIAYSVLIHQKQSDEVQQENSLNFSLIAMAAIGTITTSLIPVVYFTAATAKKFKSFINQTIEIIAVGLGSVIVFSKFGLLFNLNQRVEALSAYADMDSSQLGPVSKIQQYLHFVYSTFFSPAVFYKHGVVLEVLPQDIPVTVYIGSILISAACALGFILFFKNRFVQCSALWILFGFFLMGVMGWGSRENGMALYASYFAWAYIPLAVLPIFKITGNNYVRLGTSLVTILAIIVAMETFSSVWEIVEHSKEYMLLTPVDSYL